MGSGNSSQNKNESNNSKLSDNAKTSNEISSSHVTNEQTPPVEVIMPQTSKAKSPIAEKDIDEMFPEDQQKFDNSIRLACDLCKPDSVMKYIKPGLEKVELTRALPNSINTYTLLVQMKNLQILNISGNQLGPAGFNAVMLGLCQNSTIKTLNISDNLADTNCAETIGQMISANCTLTCLDLSGNYLGKDYFSRCVGPAMAVNNALKVLKCESIGSTDLTILAENLKKNRSLVSLNVNSNELSNAKLFLQAIADCLQSKDHAFETLELRNTGIKSGHIQLLTDSLKKNLTLTLLNISLNQVANTTELMNLVGTCICHTAMRKVICDDVKVVQVDSWSPKCEVPSNFLSSMEELSVFGCSLKDEHFASLLKYIGSGKMPKLYEVHLGNNTNLTVETLKVLHSLSTPSPENSDDNTGATEPRSCPIARLHLTHISVDGMIEYLCAKPFDQLKYLNFRRSNVTSSSVEKLSACIKKGGLQTLVLDAQKLSGSHAFHKLFSDGPHLAALSLSSCQLNDDDLQPLWTAMKTGGLPMHMLKLSANRMTDKGVVSMCEALQSNKTHPLAVLDLSTNNIEKDGVKKISELLLHKKHKSQLHSLNVANNNIASEGIVSLVSCFTRSSLLALNASSQQCSYQEEDMEDIFNEIIKSFGIKPVQADGNYKQFSSDMPNLPTGISIKLQNLGGETGELGKLLDSCAIVTEREKTKRPYLTLHHALEIAAALKNCDSAECLWSSSEWNKITGLDKEAPSWLKVNESRSRAVHMTGLPAAVTTHKMDGLLEMEADCNVDEVCLMKDTVTRNNNGNAWVLFTDKQSAERAVNFYNDGQAQVFSTPFTISALNVRVDDGANAEAETKARSEMEKRLQEKKKDEVAHKDLIHKSYLESQERHAYRLAHPAYADGRIW